MFHGNARYNSSIHKEFTHVIAVSMTHSLPCP